jgi:arsenate reductase
VISTRLDKYIGMVINEFDNIPMERKKSLQEIAGYLNINLKNNNQASAVFICTHNSRRSHICQIWAQTAAYYYGIKNFESFSGGTEVTAFHPNAVKAMKNAGFQIEILSNGNNPVYKITFSEDVPSLSVYSKKYNADINPDKNFCAVMTCSEAEENCPYIPGASFRISILYEDPKAYDGTSKEAEAYEERTHQIAREIFYLFSQVKE